MTFKQKPLNQQVIVLFGASSGIGRVTALKLLKSGAKVTATARDKTGLDSLKTEAEKMGCGDNLIALIADATLTEQVQFTADQTIAKWGRIDTWIQNSGLWLIAPFEETTEAEFLQLIDVITLGCARAAWVSLPLLKKQGGTLILLSSVEARRSLPNNSAYAAAKHAVEGFVESLRVELKHDKAPVNVTTIMPATIDTPLFEKSRVKMEGGEFKWVGPRPSYHPSIVADAILYAATHKCRDIPVGTAAWIFMQLQKISPSFMDWWFDKSGWTMEKTNMPKKKEDNLNKPIEGYDNITGDYYGSKTSKISIYNIIYNNQTMVKIGAGLGIAAGIGAVLLKK